MKVNLGVGASSRESYFAYNMYVKICNRCGIRENDKFITGNSKQLKTYDEKLLGFTRNLNTKLYSLQ